MIAILVIFVLGIVAMGTVITCVMLIPIVFPPKGHFERLAAQTKRQAEAAEQAEVERQVRIQKAVQERLAGDEA